MYICLAIERATNECDNLVHEINMIATVQSLVEIRITNNIPCAKTCLSIVFCLGGCIISLDFNFGLCKNYLFHLTLKLYIPRTNYTTH